MAALAQAVGMQKSNLLAAIAGRRPMPAESAVRLWKAIGIDEAGGLAHDRVHYWQVRHNDDLELIERTWFSTADRFAIRGKGQSPARPPLAYLVAGIGVTGDQELFAIAYSNGLTTISHKGAESLPLSIARIGDISNAAFTPDALRKLLNDRFELGVTPKTWAQFVQRATSEGLTPEDVWHCLKRTAN